MEVANFGAAMDTLIDQDIGTTEIQIHMFLSSNKTVKYSLEFIILLLMYIPTLISEED